MQTFIQRNKSVLCGFFQPKIVFHSVMHHATKPPWPSLKYGFWRAIVVVSSSSYADVVEKAKDLAYKCFKLKATRALT